MKLWFAGIAMGLWGSSVLAEETLLLEDVGQSFEGIPKVVIVATPGVDRAATLHWEQQLEQAGLDAWLLPANPERDTENAVIASIRRIDEVWESGSYDILAHGYAGRFVVDANPGARRMVLVGAPLGPQFTPTVAEVGSSGVVVEGLPWPMELLGSLPMDTLSLPLAHAYVEILHRAPAKDPDAEVFLIASGGDVVAPVETVRIPSKNWTDRSFWRADAFAVHLLKHGDLLKDKTVFRELERFLKQ